jgi:branched-chain amino acid transport system ATP-binding protein
MDEPLGGLNAEEIVEFLQVIRHVREELGITIVMVEHKTRALAEIADRILIINFGEFVMLDTPQVVLNDDHVVEIYLGKKHDA